VGKEPAVRRRRTMGQLGELSVWDATERRPHGADRKGQRYPRQD
jgi:hypothetical protein